MQASNHGARARHFQPPPRLLALIVKPLSELPASPPRLQPLSREEFLVKHGVDPTAESRVLSWLKEKKLVFRVDSRRRTVFVLGSKNGVGKSRETVRETRRGIRGQGPA